jgi:hypothetical protein
VHVLRAEKAQRVRQAVLPTLEVLAAKTEEFSLVLFRRVFEMNPELAKMFPFAKDESLRCSVLKPHDCRPHF